MKRLNNIHMKRLDQQKKKMGEKRRGISFETVPSMGGEAIVETPFRYDY